MRLMARRASAGLFRCLAGIGGRVGGRLVVEIRGFGAGRAPKLVGVEVLE
jgi:hypothetical protein